MPTLPDTTEIQYGATPDRVPNLRGVPVLIEVVATEEPGYRSNRSRVGGIRYLPHFFCFCLILAFLTLPASSEQIGHPRIAAEVRLEGLLREDKPVMLDVGEGISFELLPGKEKELLGPAESWQRLVVRDRGRKVKDLPESFYMSYTRIEASPATYWMIEEYTGGAHCCSRYHFFSKGIGKKPLRYLGSTEGSEGDTPYFDDPFIFQRGQIYFEDVDRRFAYFHTSYANSELFFPCFYHLTPSRLAVVCRQFKARYLKEAAEIDKSIEEEVASRDDRPRAILSAKHEDFSDILAQRIVKRTILYLYAREDTKAWQTLERDVRKYYKTTAGLKRIKKEIADTLRETPY